MVLELTGRVESTGSKHNMITTGVSARPEFLGVIDDPLFENLGIFGKLRGSELFLGLRLGLRMDFLLCPILKPNIMGHILFK